MDHLMIDIETWGNQSDSAIASIGAVFFNPKTGERGTVFYEKVSLKSCLDLGLKINPDTLEWWMKQSEAAREGVIGGVSDVFLILKAFDVFIKTNGRDDVKVWGNSARFDLGILCDAYKKCEMDLPWKFRNELDVRTVVWLNPEVKKEMTFEGTPHNPIDDCKHQIKYVCDTLTSIGL